MSDFWLIEGIYNYFKKEMEEIIPVQHGYFALAGLDMTGGDLFSETGYETFEEALIEAKQKISYDSNKCVGIIKHNNIFSLFIKLKNLTNPSVRADKQDDVSWKCTTILYGRRMNVVKGDLVLI